MSAVPRRTLAVALLAAACVVASVVPPIESSSVRLDVQTHHLAHAVIIALGLALGLVIASARPVREERPAWLLVAIVSPLMAMLLMIPATYDFTESHPLLHALDHLVFAALSLLTAYAGEQYLRGVGWAAAVALEMMAVGAAFGYGIILTR
ncbi:hypothetical protein EPN42_09620 [bacterium]|nr:MAG: hypothetical protein EPN42_09620 [bacterium]